jgi:hypothetical protein
VAWTWRTSADRDLKAALLIVATLLASPHVLDYDLTILGPAIAFIVAAGHTSGLRDYDISLLATAWIAPLLARAVAGATGIPIGLITLVVLYALVMRSATKARTESMIGAAGVAQA